MRISESNRVLLKPLSTVYPSRAAPRSYRSLDVLLARGEFHARCRNLSKVLLDPRITPTKSTYHQREAQILGQQRSYKPY
jgi:hypothetical protein